MRKELMGQLLALAREVAPEVEAAVAEVQDPQLRGVIAAAIMRRILEAFPVAGTQGVSAPRPSVSSSGLDQGLKASGTQGRILGLLPEGFFAEPRRLEQVLEELQTRGYHHNKSDVRMGLLRLTRKKLLRRIVYGEGRQKTFFYVNP